MSWATWIVYVVGGGVAFLAISYVLLYMLNYWYNKRFLEDKDE